MYNITGGNIGVIGNGATYTTNDFRNYVGKKQVQKKKITLKYYGKENLKLVTDKIELFLIEKQEINVNLDLAKQLGIEEEVFHKVFDEEEIINIDVFKKHIKFKFRYKSYEGKLHRIS